MTAQFIAISALLFSGLSLLLNFAAFSRAGRWKESEAAKELTATVSRHGDRLTKLEAEIEEVATKGDINTLRAEIKGGDDQLGAKIDGVKDIMSALRSDLQTIRQWTMRDPS